MLCVIRVYRDIKAPVHRSSASNEERPLFPRIKRLSTARQTRIVFLDSVYIGINTFVPPKRLPRRLSSPVLETRTYRFLVAQTGLAPTRPVRPLRPGRPPLIGPTCAASPSPAPSRPAPPCFALTRTARGLSGFWIRQVRQLGWLCFRQFRFPGAFETYSRTCSAW